MSVLVSVQGILQIPNACSKSNRIPIFRENYQKYRISTCILKLNVATSDVRVKLRQID
jgi:hypothetical protein